MLVSGCLSAFYAVALLVGVFASHGFIRAAALLSAAIVGLVQFAIESTGT
jgi:hypothetical protein